MSSPHGMIEIATQTKIRNPSINAKIKLEDYATQLYDLGDKISKLIYGKKLTDALGNPQEILPAILGMRNHTIMIRMPQVPKHTNGTPIDFSSPDYDPRRGRNQTVSERIHTYLRYIYSMVRHVSDKMKPMKNTSKEKDPKVQWIIG